ncbi:MAG: GGDEF domain-containing protein [Ruminiclostridium sp.]|nr:GGDEF domain-containing protein [Ruminiclostridium sp.]
MLYGKKVVALCIAKISDETSIEFITALNKILAENDINLFVYATCEDLFWNTPGEKGEAGIFKLIDYNYIDAVVIFDEKIYDKEAIISIISAAKAADVPVISIGDSYKDCMSISFDYESGFEYVVRHVIDVHECKSLHFMAGVKGNDFSERRIDVFRKVLAEKNIPFSSDMVSYGDFWSIPTEAATIKLLESGNIPEAIICANDTMALTVSAVLKKNGVEIPDDVIVTGFDGIEMIHFSAPKITSSRCSYTDMAAGCCELIIKSLNGEFTDEDLRIIPRFIPYESCGCHFSDSINVAEYMNDISNRLNRLQAENRTLSEVSERIQICEGIEDIANHIPHNVIYDMCCILNTECVDESINPFASVENCNDDEKVVLFDTDDTVDFKTYRIKTSEIIPNLERFMSCRIPIIFVALNFLNVSLGYACFHYHGQENENYIRIPQIVSMLNNAIGGFRNMRYQQYLNRQIEEMYLTDSLTGLYNRRGFLKKYEELLEYMRGEDCITVVLADLDGLKLINDTYGHNDGDNAIQVTARALKAACPESAICMRFGGDEMVAVIGGMYPRDDIRNSINACLEEYNRNSGKPYRVSASIGVHTAPVSASSDFEALVKKSDKLMYEEKKLKKSRKSI